MMASEGEPGTETPSTEDNNEILVIHKIAYLTVLPILVSLGILTNSVCVLILRRPRLWPFEVTRYFLVLVVSDLLVCVFYVPIIITINGCTFNFDTGAKYYAHFSWSVIGIWQSIATFTILWLAMDRFLAVWMPWTYRRIHKWPNFMSCRMLVTVVFCFLIHVAFMGRGTVESPLSPVCGKVTDALHNVTDSYGNSYQDKSFGYGYVMFYFAVTMWVPCALLVIFNAGLVIAVVKGRFRFPEKSSKAATTATTSPSNHAVLGSKKKKLVVTIITMSISFILFMLPITISLSLSTEKHATNYGYCCVPSRLNTFRDVSDVSQLFEHVLHVFFLSALNSKFREELRSILHLKKSARNGERDRTQLTKSIYVGEQRTTRIPNDTNGDRIAEQTDDKEEVDHKVMQISTRDNAMAQRKHNYSAVDGRKMKKGCGGHASRKKNQRWTWATGPVVYQDEVAKDTQANKAEAE